MKTQSASHSSFSTSRSFWNVPVSFTSMVGREQEVAALVHLLCQPAIRLVTLLGPAGIGKTRLSMQLAQEVRSYFSDGVCFVALASIHSPERVIPTIAESLDIQQRAATSLFEQVAYVLSNRQMLLILDNFEQVVSAAPLLEDLLGVCLLLKLLLTSREVLRLQAEHEFPVSPLTLPSLKQTLERRELSRYSALTLFEQRAQMVLPDFQLTPKNARAVAELCTHLDGLPLAIELAASRIKLLSPEALLKRLSRRFEILTGGARTLPDRHQTLYNAIKWSYDLLNEQEQWLLRRLCMFVGGWTLEPAGAVCAGLQGMSVLDGIASLLNKSLLLRSEQEGGELRPYMLMSVREFGLACLRGRGELEQAQLAHARYFLSFAEESVPNLKSAGQLTWLPLLELEQGNLRAALERLIAAQEAELALRLCGALRLFWLRCGYWNEGRVWLRAALDLPIEGVQPATRANALYTSGVLTWFQGDDAEACLFLEQSVALFRQSGNEDDLIEPVSLLGSVLHNQGEVAEGNLLEEEGIALSRKLNKKWQLANIFYRRGQRMWVQNDPLLAIQLTEESLSITRELEDTSLTANILNNLAYMARQQKNLAQAAALTKENLLLARQLNDQHLLNSTLETLGLIALDQKEFAQAKAYFIESIVLAQQLGRKYYSGYCLTLLAEVATAQGQFQQAARLYGAAEKDLDTYMMLSTSEQAEYQRNVASVRAQLGDGAFAAALTEGRTLTVEQALALLEVETPPEPAPVLLHQPSIVPSPARTMYPDDLTPREVEVLPTTVGVSYRL